MAPRFRWPAPARAVAGLAALRGGTNATSVPFEIVAEEVFKRYRRRREPRTFTVNQGYCRQQILPWFQGTPIASIAEREVQAWFASLCATPAAADRALPVLSVILRQAEIYGYRPEGSNPCLGIRRYRRRGRERFPGAEEPRRPGAALDRHARRRPLAAAAIRLILLTRCHKSEILDLRWTGLLRGQALSARLQDRSRTVWLAACATPANPPTTLPLEPTPTMH